WLNALLGRLFFTWKTDKIRSMFYSKIKSKIDQLNARRPSFLEEITIRSFDEGHRPPHFSDPQLIHLSSHGEYVADVMMHYEGECRVELETVLQWKYSDRLPPIQLDIVLAVTCQSMSGKMRVRIKEPPSNILWIGFHKAPHMKWYVEPVFWEKRMGYSLVS
ncbi:putative integral membrane protein conserved region-domain-containing protein, partial [Pilobolus umbonatus]